MKSNLKTLPKNIFCSPMSQSSNCEITIIITIMTKMKAEIASESKFLFAAKSIKR